MWSSTFQHVRQLCPDTCTILSYIKVTTIICNWVTFQLLNYCHISKYPTTLFENATSIIHTLNCQTHVMSYIVKRKKKLGYCKFNVIIVSCISSNIPLVIINTPSLINALYIFCENSKQKLTRALRCHAINAQMYRCFMTIDF